MNTVSPGFPTMEDVRKCFNVAECLLLGIAAVEIDARSTRAFAASINLALYTSDYLASEAEKLGVNPADVAAKVDALSFPIKRLLLRALHSISATDMAELVRDRGFQDVMRLHGILDIPGRAVMGIGVVRLSNWATCEFALDRGAYDLAKRDKSPLDMDRAVAQIFRIARQALKETAPPSKIAVLVHLLHRISLAKKQPLLRVQEIEGDYEIVAIDPKLLRADLADEPERRIFIAGVNAPSVSLMA